MFRGTETEESFPGCVCTSDVRVGSTRVTLPLSGMTQVLLCSSPCCGLLIRSDSKRNSSGLASAGSGGRSEVPTCYQPPHKPLYTSRGKILGFRLSSHDWLLCNRNICVKAHSSYSRCKCVCVCLSAAIAFRALVSCSTLFRAPGI